MDATGSPLTDEWNKVDWRKAEIAVFKLQRRIYRASERGDVHMIHRLQRLLIRSRAARLLATRRVTQDNRGKKTAGVDGVKSLAPPERLALTQDLRPSPKTRPLRRVWIPKPGTEEKRPLGIPTIRVRAEQALVKLALEPEWEAKFETHSYGFRPGRSAHDAVGAIFNTIRYQAKYVLDADITKCFDRINHQALLQKLDTFPALQRVIKGWLEAGVMDEDELFPTEMGTPQGGVISPLLANIALHGLEEAVTSAFQKKVGATLLVRYADDFVVLHRDLAVIEETREVIAQWLNGLGLELKPSKTRLTHTLKRHEGNVGFDFLGFTVRQFPVGKYRTAKNTNGKPLGFKTLIKPSRDAQKRHQQALAAVVRAHKTAPQSALIHHLNPTIRGWSNYHCHVVAKKTFATMDNLMYLKLRRWANRRHPNKNAHWIAGKYWHPVGARKWVFQTAEGYRLLSHQKIPITRHVLVQGTRSPYDGDWAYWSARQGSYPNVTPEVAKLLKLQKGICPWCRLYFRPGDVLERDHIIPREQGGSAKFLNKQLLHGHCHDEKTARDRSHADEVPKQD